MKVYLLVVNAMIKMHHDRGKIDHDEKSSGVMVVLSSLGWSGNLFNKWCLSRNLEPCTYLGLKGFQADHKCKSFEERQGYQCGWREWVRRVVGYELRRIAGTRLWGHEAIVGRDNRNYFLYKHSLHLATCPPPHPLRFIEEKTKFYGSVWLVQICIAR